MRIGIDISQLAYSYSGVAVYTRELVNQLLGLDNNNDYILFASSLRKYNELQNIYFDWSTNRRRVIKKTYMFPISFLELLWNRLHILPVDNLIGKLDIFHTSDWLEPPSYSRKVTTIHDMLVYKFPQDMHPKIVDNQKQKLSWVKKESRAIIVDSISTKNDVKEFLLIPDEKIHVVYLGISESFKPQNLDTVKQMKTKYGIDGDYLLALGTLEPRKNIARVIEAYENLSLKKTLNLIIAGRFVWGEKLKTPAGVTVIETIDYNDLPSLYTGARCLIYPSLYEGFGLPVLEAMKCGCPAITSNRGSLKEVAGEAAIIVDPERIESIGEGIKTVIHSSNNSYLKIKEKGINWASKFTWEKTAKETLDVYLSLL